jgi:hypothetical protein
VVLSFIVLELVLYLLCQQRVTGVCREFDFVLGGYVSPLFNGGMSTVK